MMAGIVRHVALDRVWPMGVGVRDDRPCVEGQTCVC
jgi:hypothetical protein